jgi:hypothetical protein
MEWVRKEVRCNFINDNHNNQNSPLRHFSLYYYEMQMQQQYEPRSGRGSSS